MAYEDYCASCTYMREHKNCGKYWCEIKGEDRPASNNKCENHIEAYSRSNYTREEMYNYSKDSGSSSCYLTTIMCHLLGYKDDNYYLNTLRNFRNNIMSNNSNYLPLLLTYDVVGPVISEKLENDQDGKAIASTFFTNFIEKAVTAIEEEKNETAINIYRAMTEALAEKYKIMIPVLEVNSQDTNSTALGHGRIKSSS